MLEIKCRHLTWVGPNLHPTLKNQQILKTFLWKIYLLKICYYWYKSLGNITLCYIGFQ